MQAFGTLLECRHFQRGKAFMPTTKKKEREASIVGQLLWTLSMEDLFPSSFPLLMLWKCSFIHFPSFTWEIERMNFADMMRTFAVGVEFSGRKYSTFSIPHIKCNFVTVFYLQS